IGSIAAIGHPSGESALKEGLDNPNEDNEARAQAATGLGRIGTPSAVNALITALGDYDLKVQLAASAALARVGRAAVNPLLAALRSSDSLWRIRAADALGRIHALEATPGVVAALSDKDSRVRAAAASALGFQGNAAAVPALSSLLSDKDA